jgi:hypothetical protein
MVMADKSTSPFSGLDKALLRSTKPSTHPPISPEKTHNTNREDHVGVSDKQNPEPTYRPPNVSTTRPIDEPTIRPDDIPTGRREFIRRGFEWYADQLRALKKLSLEEQMEGKPGNMSQMVREALDDYLKKRAATK